MSGSGAKAVRQRKLGQLRAVLEQLDAGNIRVSGNGHSAAKTRRRLETRIAELEGGEGKGS